MKSSTRTLLILAGLVAVLFLGAWTYALLPTHTRSIAASEPPAADAASIERGRDKMHALREIGSFVGDADERPLPF